MVPKILLFFGAVLLVTKEQSALYIHDCLSGVRDVTEDTCISFTCGEYSDYIDWHFSHDHQPGNYIGYCSSSNCFLQNSSLFTLQAQSILQEGYESTLGIRNVTRQQNYFLRCNEGDTTATCRLRVIAPAILKNCDVSINNWQLHGSCVVENMYASDGNNSCRWRVNNAESTGYFHNSLSLYWLGKRTYRRGVCYFSHTVPVDEGSYMYSVNIDSGLWNTARTINIVHPGNPYYTCPVVVQEGSSFSCTCTSSNPGNPPAELVWDGLNTDTLSVRNILRKDRSIKYTCRLIWGLDRFINREAVLMFTIAVPVSIVPNSCSVQLLRWKLHGVCTIQWMDKISDIPKCRWRFSYQYFSRPTAYDLEGIEGSLSFFTVDFVGYKRRNCSFEQLMPVTQNDYSYSIRVSSHQDDQFSKTLRIVHPGRATYTCPATVFEGSSFSCNCSSSNAGTPSAEFLWEGVNSDILHFHNVQRQDSGNNYTCRLKWGPNVHIIKEAVYILKVIAPVSIVPNSCGVQLSGWKVSGVCTIQWWITMNNPTCKWSFENKENTEVSPVFQLRGNYIQTDSVYYFRGNCSFMHQMPVDNGNYTYSMSVSLHPADQFSMTFNIEKPAALQHNCPKNILEGSDINCTCFTLNPGNPPAQIGWAELSKEDLFIEGIKRGRSGHITTCNLTWGTIKKTLPYEVNVSYGPSGTYINSSVETLGDQTRTVLICTAIDVYPSAVFRWSISCDNVTQNVNTSKCTLFTRVEDEMEVECNANNQIFVEVSSTGKYVLKPRHNSFQWGIIGGSAGAVLILAVVVAVIIVCIKRRKTVNKNRMQTPIVRFAAPSGDIYTVAGNVDDEQDEYVTVLDNIPETQSVEFGALYAIADPATAVENKEATKQEATKNRQYATQRITGHQAKNTAPQKNDERKSNKPAINPKPTRLGKKKPKYLSVDNKLETHTPAEHFTASSEDLYTITGPATAGEDKQVTVQKATKNRAYAAKSNSGKKKPRDMLVHGYMNVTEVPTDSGLGVYHIVPWSAIPQAVDSSDARSQIPQQVLDTSVISEEEYNVLRFQEDRTRQEDYAVTYNHLYFK